jgi:vacuolar-type H+-ATPase subunit C/Vma6
VEIPKKEIPNSKGKFQTTKIYFFDIWNLKIVIFKKLGGLAQLARAPALHAGGQRFESVILHI